MPLIATRYAKEASELINAINKSIVVLIFATIGLVIFNIFDVIGMLYIVGLYTEMQHDIIVAIVSIALLALVAFILSRIFKIKRVLNTWNSKFELSSINASIGLLMSNLDKREAIIAIAESIGDLNRYMKRYIDNDDLGRFIDVEIDGLRFDILIDASNAEDDLKQFLLEHGSIIAKVTDHADKHNIDRFYEDVLRYSKVTSNKVGLALMISSKVEDYDIKAGKDVDKFLIVEKPNI